MPADPAAMSQIAAATGGHTFTAQTIDQLRSVYNEIGRVVGYNVQHRDITAWFIGIALLLMMTAAAAALTWNQRLV